MCVLILCLFVALCACRFCCLPAEEAKHSGCHCRLCFLCCLDCVRLGRCYLRHLARGAAPPVPRVLLVDVLYLLVGAVHVLVGIVRRVIRSRQHHIAMVLVTVFLIVRQVVRIHEIIIKPPWFDSQVSIRVDTPTVMLSMSALCCFDRHLLIL